jgi:hypothetical protein
MCGQVGIIFGRKRRRAAEMDRLIEVFVRLLLHSEVRGPTPRVWPGSRPTGHTASSSSPSPQGNCSTMRPSWTH